MEHERSRMTVWSFLKGLFKVVIGFSLLVQSLLFLFILILVAGVLGSVSSSLSGKNPEGPSITVPDGGALVLNPEGVLVELAPPQDPFESIINEAFGGSSDAQISVHELVRVIRAAEEDKRIQAMVLDLQGLYIPSISASKAYYLADAVQSFRDSGKRVIAVGDGYSQEQYIIASKADTILMHDFGSLMIDGYGSYRQFYKSALDKLEVTANVFRVGTFKSAIEPYIRDDMSEPAKEANRAFLGSLWEDYTTAIDTNRGLTAGSTERLVNNAPAQVRQAGGSIAQMALDNGLVDKLMDRGAQIDFIAGIVGRDADDQAGFRGIGYRSYRLAMQGPHDRDKIGNIAVVTVAGAIVDGEEQFGAAGGDFIASQLRDARTRDDVKAVVLRVDSPGGSAFASEIIRDELLKVKEAGKPVVVSMGSLAASGGYWISASADEIWASPSTVTGSIGVFGFIPTFEKTLEKVGVYTDGVGTTPLAPITSVGPAAVPEAYAEIIQANVEDIYKHFLQIVAEGRGMTTVGVDEIGQGRVWIGETASQIGLVDKLGDIDDAIASAAARASLEDYDVVGLTREKTRFETLLEQLAQAETDASAGQASLADEIFAGETQRRLDAARIVKAVKDEADFFASFNDPSSIYVRCMECPGQ
ncbi:signal peptide peptidase SppA [Parvularcula sp. LCG005]|uniref:signal peptide peptidase SppA n=1 Tax=Parvularcula sp. LCG005 TaxID=3078805 RepID=UPI00294230E5|nr:signal peptide peptidase SppA [Parvularcula sp. LCG005]WOI52032.1 signal peptide peptidase SppA [Parvularcula sp. LCG005]